MTATELRHSRAKITFTVQYAGEVPPLPAIGIGEAESFAISFAIAHRQDLKSRTPIVPRPGIARSLSILHRQCGRSSHIVALALKVRNQANAVIRARMSDGIFAIENGEQLLIDVVAPHAHRFIDVGANVGAWTLAFAEKCAKPACGWLFEPSPVAYQRLRHVVDEVSRESDIALELVCLALADVPGELTFQVEPDAGETSSFVPGHSSRVATSTVVRVGTLDDELAKRSIEQVDLLKIDAEGFDCKVLRGAAKAIRRQALGVIQFEYNAPWAKAGDTLYGAMEQVVRSGYEIYILKRRGLYRFDYERFGEFFGYSNFVAVSRGYLAMVSPIVVGEI